MIKNYQTEAIVIKRINIGEADKLLTLYTRTYGKIVVIAKGVRKIHSRKASHVELFNYIKAMMANGKRLDIIQQAEKIISFDNLRTKLERTLQAYRVVEVIDRVCMEQDVNSWIFFLLFKTLRDINSITIDKVKIAADVFIASLLGELGFLPRNQPIKQEVLADHLRTILEDDLKSDKFLEKHLNSSCIRR